MAPIVGTIGEAKGVVDRSKWKWEGSVRNMVMMCVVVVCWLLMVAVDLLFGNQTCFRVCQGVFWGVLGGGETDKGDKEDDKG